MRSGSPIRVVNLSLGGSRENPEMLGALRELDSLGTLVCVAAGNSGDGNERTVETSFPATSPTVVAVAAYDPRTGLPAAFTNTNPEVDCAACGVRVISTIPGGLYAVYDGTSMAAAHISGFCCLLYEMVGRERPELRGVGLLREVKRRLLDYTAGREIGGTRRNNSLGYGPVRYDGP